MAQSKRLLIAAITWTNAFMIFKRMHLHYSLPVNQTTANEYRDVVSMMNSIGEALLGLIETEAVDFEGTGISFEGLKASVGELS